MLDAGTITPFEQPMTRRSTLARSDVLVGAVLVIVMLLGGYFRFVGLNWDDYIHFHPDERFLTGVATALGRPLSAGAMTGPDLAANEEQYQRCLMRYPATAGAGGYFDTECSTLNPHNTGNGLYVYGTLPLFLARWAGDLVVQVTGDSTWVSYEGIHLVWRALSGLADMAAIAGVFCIGLRLHGKSTGLVAAMLYAATVFPIQQAHFGTTDAMSSMFVVYAILFAVSVQLDGKPHDYVLFGLFAGAALASRINTAPVVGLIVLAAGLRLLPAFDGRLAWGERERIILEAVGGLVLAFVTTFVCFRIFNPYAFMGPSIFGVIPNRRWLDDMATAQNLVSGRSEIPPNWQWVGRPSYIYPLSNIVLWGAGVALGVAGWLSWVWSGYRLIRGRAGATLNLLLFVWVLVYFGFLGRQWVMTMRYYLPIYPILAVLAAWGLVELVRRANGKPVLRSIYSAVLVVVVGATFLWAGMFTNIYRHMMTVVQASNWVWENISGDFSMRIEGAPPGTPLVNIAMYNSFGADGDLAAQASRYEDGDSYAYNFTAPADGIVTSVHAPHLGDPLDDPQPETLRITITRPEDNVELTRATFTDNFVRTHHLVGDAYDIPLDEPLVLEMGKQYVFRVEAVSGGPIISAGGVMSWDGDWEEVVPPKVCTLPPGITLADDPPPGMFSANTCNGRDPWAGLLNNFKLQLIYDDGDVKRDIMYKALDNSDYIFIGTNRRYDSQPRLIGRWPMTERYFEALFSGELGFELVEIFQETYELGPLRVSDSYLPTYDAPRWLNEFEAEEAFTVYDHPVAFIFRKTDAYSPEKMRDILGSVPTNTVEQAQLYNNCPDVAGDTVVSFYCDPTLVGMKGLRNTTANLDYSMSADQAPTYLLLDQDSLPRQYDNGTWSDRFDTNSVINTQPVLLVFVWWLTIVLFGWAAFPLLFTVFPGLADRGYGFAKIAGIFVVSWVVWFASSLRIDLSLWSDKGVLLGLVALAVVSVLVALRAAPRTEDEPGVIAYVQSNWRVLVGIEAITLLLFIGFLLVRLTNPDLWHPGYGGEKPMDFAYWNGVLRSTTFPPIDPWFAGGYINYYYYGFVIVGTPVLLLGVAPSIAYNLVIPTIFALTGIGAFSAAYNAVSAWRERRVVESDDGAEPVTRRVTLGNPWMAGVVALLLAVVLGNLDTPRVFLGRLAEIGGARPIASLQDFLIEQYKWEHGTDPDEVARLDITARAESGSPADQLAFSYYSFTNGIGGLLNGARLVFLTREEPFTISPDRWFWGPTRVLAEPPVNSGGAIAEMPYFTFLYGDLHAHMIAMPLQFFALGFLLNELALAGRGQRSGFRRTPVAAGLAIFVGALTVGMLRATNTWDWVTYMALSVAGLGFAWWLRWRHINRQSVLNGLARVGGFVALTFLVALPFTTWFAAVYSSVQPWTGNKTPLWAYFDIHGLFLFLIASLLVWDTARWFGTIRVRSLRGTWNYILFALIISGAALLLLMIVSIFIYRALILIYVALGLTLIGWVRLRQRSEIGGSVLLALALIAGLLLIYLLGMIVGDFQVALVVLPLLLWIVVLFFRSGQSRVMQFLLALAGLALALTLVVEFVVLEGDIGRQNTVFKFYIQVWLLFSVIGGAAFAWLSESSSRWTPSLRWVWYGIAGLLFFVAALFPMMATPGKAAFRMAADTPPTIDGMEFMKYASQYEGSPTTLSQYPQGAPFPLVDDYNVIRWLQENVQGTPVVMEGRSEREYLWGSRVSIYTGMSSVVGWNWHQRQQRTFNPMPRVVEQRVANVNAFYATTDIPEAWRILRFYDVSYVVVSGLERAYYPPRSLAKFDQMVDDGLLEVVFEQDEAVIYKVNRDAPLAENVAAEERMG